MSKVNNIEIRVIDTEIFNKLTQNEKQIFEAFRDALLLIFPTEENEKSYSDESISYAEKSAFEFLNKLPESIKNPISIESILEIVKPLISAATPTQTL